MYRLVPALVQQMGETYQELVRGQPLITETLKLEETRFRKTLEKGLGLLDEASGSLKKGDVLRRRYRLQALRHLRLPARPHAGCAQAARHHRRHGGLRRGDGGSRRRRRASPGRAPARRRPRAVWFEVREKVGATDFLGYDTETAKGEVRAILKDGKEAKSLEAGDEGALVLNQTPFYGESGGQVGDAGRHQGRQGRAVPRHRHAEEAGRRVRPHRPRGEGHASSRATRSSSSSITRAAPRPAPTTPPPICCTRRCARCSARTWRRRARWWSPSACASTSPTPSP